MAQDLILDVRMDAVDDQLGRDRMSGQAAGTAGLKTDGAEVSLLPTSSIGDDQTEIFALA
jgi:hypothetical protein